MWLLFSDGPALDGKRIWLRPGITHLLGRTSAKAAAGRQTFIDDKSVSRQHLTINVHAPVDGSGLRIYEKTKIEITDTSKVRTTINGEEIKPKEIKQATRTIGGSNGPSKFALRLGNYEHLFHLTWQPVVLSASGSAKLKEEQRVALEQADVKVVKEYLANETTHVVAKKRNTAASLQALVQARWLVTDEFVKALVEAVTPPDGVDGETGLEKDFDQAWPKEAEYLVPPGDEPNPRSNHLCLPDERRAELFSDFAFLFLMPGQYDTLLPVIIGGGGKALLWELEGEEDNASAAVEYIKSVAGHKGSSQFKLSQMTGPGGVVIVRPNTTDSGLIGLIDAIESAVQQRPIDQKEFTDVILTRDTSTLREPSARTPPMPPPAAARSREVSASPVPPAPRQSQWAATVQRSQAEEEPAPRTQQVPEEDEPIKREPPTTGRRKRYITQIRFKGFDDVDPSQFTKPATQSPAPSMEQPEPSQEVRGADMDIDETSQPPTQQDARKRAAPVNELPDEEEFYNQLLPGQAALKRQKTEAAAKRGDKGAERELEIAKHVAEEKARAKKKKAKQMDVMAEVQKRREKEEEQRRLDEEALQNAMEGVNISEVSKRVVIEDMDLPMRSPQRAVRKGARRAERWKAEWNGRKNFKKFRPQGTAQSGQRLQRVIVTLEEVPKKNGLGDDYWLHTTRPSKGKGKSQSQSQSQRQRSQHSQHDDEQDDGMAFRRRLEASRREDERDAHFDEVDADEVAGRARDAALQAAVQGSPSQTMRSESQRKRPAATQGSAGPAKRARAGRAATRQVVNLDDDDDDDDELKFRRRARR